jgi:response regulator RpfG family c-di-GMP phosphodiesterase
MTQVSNECIGFLYRELLSQLIESTLLLKKEENQRNYYLNLTLQPHQTKPMGQIFKSQSSPNDYIFQPITPSEVMETCRRCLLRKNSTVVNKFQKCSAIKNKNNQLIFF